MANEKRTRTRVDYDAAAFIDGVSQRLTPEQVGVYWMLCSMMYQVGGPIAYDARGIANSFAQTNARTISRIVDSLISLGKIEISLPISDSSLGNSVSQVCPYLSNKRTMEEIKRTRERIENGRKFGQLGGRPKAENSHSADADPFQNEKGHPFPEEKASRARETFNDSTKNAVPREDLEKGKGSAAMMAKLRTASKGHIDETSTAILSLAPLIACVANGADFEADILPAVAEVCAKLTKPLRTWSAPWLQSTIARNREARLREAGAIPIDTERQERAWRVMVVRYRDTGGAWEAGWGPRPGEPGCQVPIELATAIFAERGQDLTERVARMQLSARREA